MITALLIILVLAALLALVEGLARAALTLREDRPQRLTAVTPDGWELAVWYRPASQRRFVEPVVLCHGLANNAVFMDFHRPWSVAASLAEAGFDCYSVDMRGAGGSRPPDAGPWDADVDAHIALDAPALVDFVLRHAGASQVLWVGHSLGGLIGLAAAAGGPLAGRVAGLVTLGSPFFFERPKLLARLTWLGHLFAPAGRFPLDFLAGVGAPLAGWFFVDVAAASANLRNIDLKAQRALLANVFAPLWRGVLAQLGRWITTDRFCSRDGRVDYREAVRALALPILVAGGTLDGLAPPGATRRYFEALTTQDKELVLFGRAYGQAEDYGHGDLIIGKNVEAEVYPVLRRWLTRHARAWEGRGAVSGSLLGFSR